MKKPRKPTFMRECGRIRPRSHTVRSCFGSNKFRAQNAKRRPETFGCSNRSASTDDTAPRKEKDPEEPKYRRGRASRLPFGERPSISFVFRGGGLFYGELTGRQTPKKTGITVPFDTKHSYYVFRIPSVDTRGSRFHQLTSILLGK